MAKYGKPSNIISHTEVRVLTPQRILDDSYSRVSDFSEVYRGQWVKPSTNDVVPVSD